MVDGAPSDALYSMYSRDVKMYILGINSAYHESAAGLLHDGALEAAAEEERFNRSKHGKPARVDNPDQLPLGALRFCLEEAGRRAGRRVSLGEVEHLGYSLDLEARRAQNSAHRHPYTPLAGDFGDPQGEALFHRRLRAVAGRLSRRGFRGRFHFLPHHDCHAASAFFVSPFEEAAVLVIDGIGEFDSTTLYHGAGNQLARRESLPYPHSLGFVWEKLSKFLGFTEYDAAKVMGLASYGDPEPFRHAFRSLVQVKGGGFTVNDRVARLRLEDYAPLEAHFGLPKRQQPVEEAAESVRPYADLAAALQEVTQEVVLALARRARQLTGMRRLCLAGGVALNCVANGRLLASGLFDQVFIQPAAHDGGTALGACYLVWHQVLGRPRSEPVLSPYLGPEFSAAEIERALGARGLRCEQRPDVEAATARLLAAGKVVGWFQGGMELGPRALGNRSILADPRRPEMVALLNRKVKHREPFRPFCPSVLAAKADDWFDIRGSRLPAAYMLATYPVRPERRRQIPAVTHVDGTSRAQLVDPATNPRFHRLIEEFERLTGVPVLLNTSFNDGEPIVCSPADAVRTFLATRIDVLVAGDFIVHREANQVEAAVPDLPLTDYFERLR